MTIAIQSLTPLIQVFDMANAIEFYCGALGFEIRHTSGGERFYWALLRRDGVELMLNTAYDDDKRPASPDPRRVASHGDTALFFACDDVDAAYAYLKEKGVPIAPPVVQDYGMKQLYVTDPDGYSLCFQCPVETVR